MSTVPVLKQSFFDKLTQSVYLDYVLKVIGVALFALAMFKGWPHLPFFTKVLLIISPLTWYVGDKFNKIYR